MRRRLLKIASIAVDVALAAVIITWAVALFAALATGMAHALSIPWPI